MSPARILSVGTFALPGGGKWSICAQMLCLGWVTIFFNNLRHVAPFWRVLWIFGVFLVRFSHFGEASTP